MVFFASWPRKDELLGLHRDEYDDEPMETHVIARASIKID